MTIYDTQQDVYRTVAELIGHLNAQGQHKLAIILEHRMYKVPWTSSSELFDELERVLTNALTEYKALLDKQSLDKVRSIIELLNARASK
ncbi:MAG: hypothetical protein ACREXU_03245 [Gammaproteobacteria bacterium]